jgi:hypothetical protein
VRWGTGDGEELELRRVQALCHGQWARSITRCQAPDASCTAVRWHVPFTAFHASHLALPEKSSMPGLAVLQSPSFTYTRDGLPDR